jgi:hypothetical protein
MLAEPCQTCREISAAAAEYQNVSGRIEKGLHDFDVRENTLAVRCSLASAHALFEIDAGAIARALNNVDLSIFTLKST